MRTKRLKFSEGFRVAFEVRKAQAAEMVIAPGNSEGGPDNRHRVRISGCSLCLGGGLLSFRSTVGSGGCRWGRGRWL